MAEIQRAPDGKLAGTGTMTLHLAMGQSRTRVTFGVIDRLAVHLLLVTTFVDKYISSIHPAKRNIFPHHIPLVPILMVYETKSDAEKSTSDICQLIEENPALLRTHVKESTKILEVPNK